MFRDGTLPLLYRSLLPGVDKVPVLLFGDPAYTLVPHLMKEFTTCTTNEQVMSNDLLRSSRNLMECTGYLKERWQILNKPIDMKLERATDYIFMLCPA